MTSAPTTVVGGTNSLQRDTVTLLAGSPSAVVFKLSHVTASDIATYSGNPTSPAYELLEQSAGGQTKVLAQLSESDQSLIHWSMSGDILTAVDISSYRQVRWWNVSTGGHGELTVPKDSYVSAAPNGVLYMTAHGRLTLERLSGITTVLSRPFHQRPIRFFPAVDGNGVVLGADGGQARYVAFRHPSRVRHLKTGTHRAVICRAVSSRYAACTIGGQGPSNATQAALIALDGSAPTTSHDPQEEPGGQVTLSGTSRVAWPRLKRGLRPGLVLASLGARSRHRAVGTQHIAFKNFVFALGRAVVTPFAKHRIVATTGKAAAVTIAKAPPSPATSAGFALTPDRIVDVDDEVDDVDMVPLAVRSRPLTTTSDGVSSGTPQIIARGTPGKLPLGPVVASGATVAYTTATNGFGPVGLHVMTSDGETVIPNVKFDVALSGRWVAYWRNNGNANDLYARDLDTGTDLKVQTVLDHPPPGMAVANDRLDYATPDGSIQQLDLATGTQVQLAPAVASVTAVDVYASGDRVGWEVSTTGPSGRQSVDTIRESDRTLIHLDQHLIGLSADGALLSTVPTAQTFNSQVKQTISLRSWDGTTSQVLPNARYAAAPQVAGGRIAWQTVDGELKVARLI